MPSLRCESRVHEDDHADDGLDVIRDAGAGDDPPADDAECTNRERCDVLVLFGCKDICKMILPLDEKFLIS